MSFFNCLILFSCIIATIKCSNIIIIGAGPSGIAAGTKLLEKGITNITILEAENRIGGRVYTINFGDSVADIGAQWCHGEVGNVVFEMANPLGLLDHPEYKDDDTECVDSTGYFVPHDIGLNLLALWDNATANRDNDMQNFEGSMGEYVIKKFKEKTKNYNTTDSAILKMFLDRYEQLSMGVDGSDNWFEVSAKRQDGSYYACEGDNLLHWKGKGYKTILDVMMKKIPDPSKQLPLEDKVLLNKEVVNIKWNDGDLVTVECKDGTSYTANYVLVTVSLGVLKERHATLFTPELPTSTQTAINTLGYGTVDKLIFKFPNRWWDISAYVFLWNQNKDIGSLYPGDEWLKDVSYVHSVDTQPNVLMSWICGHSAHQMEALSDEVVKNKTMQLIRHFLGANYTIPDPDGFIRTRWYSNPHFRGSYSFHTVTSDKKNVTNIDLATPLKNANGKEVVFFAGEATMPRYHSTVHGAIGSGWREANRLIGLYGS